MKFITPFIADPKYRFPSRSKNELPLSIHSEWKCQWRGSLPFDSYLGIDLFKAIAMHWIECSRTGWLKQGKLLTTNKSSASCCSTVKLNRVRKRSSKNGLGLGPGVNKRRHSLSERGRDEAAQHHHETTSTNRRRVADWLWPGWWFVGETKRHKSVGGASRLWWAGFFFIPSPHSDLFSV